MSNCSDPYNNVCRQDIPYPQVSPESVPSLIDNLVTALYGAFYNPQTGQGYVTKSVVNGRVVWTSACDPNNTAEIAGVPRNDGEGLLCYIIRIFALYDPTGYAKLVGPQTITNSTFNLGTVSNCTFINPTGLTKADVGLGNVDNTADASKPISGPQTTFVNNQIAAALAAYVAPSVANLVGGVTGSVPYQSAPSTTVFLAPSGTAGFVLTSNGPGLAPSWQVNSTVSASAANITGGAAGEILYQSASGVTAKLAAGTNNFVLVYNTATNAPVWTQKAPQASFSDSATKALNIDGGAYGDLLYQTAANTTAKLGVGSAGSVLQTGVAPSTPPAWVPTATAATANAIAKRDASGNLTASSFVGNLSGNASTATGLQPVPGLASGTYGGVSSVPVMTITSGGQIVAASSQPVPILPTLQTFSEDKNTYANIHRFGGGMAFIDSNNWIRFYGLAQASGSSPNYGWNSAGLGSASNALGAQNGLIISPEYEVAGEYAVKLYFHHRAIFVLTNVGNLYAAGENTIGQLGFSGITTVFPRKVAISNVIDFSVSQGGNIADIMYCIAVVANGSVFTWGYNATGQLGNGTTTNITTPTNITALVNVSNGIQGKLFDKCYAGGTPGYCYVIERTTKTVYASGYNGFGQLGLNNGNANVSWFTVLPTLAGSPTTADEIYTSGGTNPVILATNHNRATSFILLGGQVFAAGSDVAGETGQGTFGSNLAQFRLITGLSNIVDLSVSNGFGGLTQGAGVSVAARDNLGQFWVWGNNTEGQFGNNPSTTPANSAVPIFYTGLEFQPRASDPTVTPWPASRYAQKIKFIGGPDSAGNLTYGVRCFVLDVNGQMWMAGKAGVYEFGDGYNIQNNQVIFRPVRQPPGVQFTDFDVTASLTGAAMRIFAKDTAGNVWAWGDNTFFGSGSSANNNATQTPQRLNFF
jgi:alpha-tubulin suppressor-like RCC1 family protein